jgi:hypothetical protein
MESDRKAGLRSARIELSLSQRRKLPDGARAYACGEGRIEKRQQELLAARYDLSDRPVLGVTMSRGKAIQGGVRMIPVLREGTVCVVSCAAVLHGQPDAQPPR